MFENLKALIRHGKQANELKKKPLEIGNPTLIDTNNNYHTLADYSLSNLPSVSDSSEATLAVDVGAKNETQHQNQYQTQNQNQHQHQQQHIPIEVVSDHTQTNSTQTQNHNHHEVPSIEVENNVQNNAQNNQAKAQNNQYGNGYQDAATQIVEQENLLRQKGTIYPKLDNYVILEQMGEGAFSVVYKAQNKTTGAFVAVKILRKFQMDQAQKQSVLKEVTIMRQLDHPNVVKFIEFIDCDQYYYIVQELAVGGEVFTAIVKYTYLSEDLSRHVISQVASAIRYLHEEVGIVHRDIKPENILYSPIDFKPSANPIAKLRKSDDPNAKLDEGEFTAGVGGGGIGTVKLADFGLSKQIWEHNTKTPCGTVGYTAPEIVRDEKYSKEVDMWAIGCVLYTLLCGFPPFYDERIESLTEKVARGEYTFLTPWWDEISPLAKNCVTKLLTVDPSVRYTIDDFMNDPWMQLGQQSTSAPRQPTYSQSASNYDASMGPPPKKVPALSQDSTIHPINNTIANSSASARGGAAARYSKKYMNSDLYSPAAVALRDAFDISAAVHRMGEEAALSNKFGNTADMQELIEEQEEEEEAMQEAVDNKGQVLSNIPRQAPRFKAKNPNVNNNNLFDLNLGGASILERRNKNKPINI